jgi:SAM-dependent methyltransferase
VSGTDILKKIPRSLCSRGLFGSIRHAIRLFTSRTAQWHKRRVRRRIDSQFDRAYGVDTAGTIPPGALALEGLNAQHAAPYQAVFPAPFLDVMRQLPIRYEQSIFVDFGSGKGRAVLLASEFPFMKIIGIELSPHLCAIAKANRQSYRSATQKCTAIEFVCIDAAHYDIPPQPAVLFLYNPFHGDVMKQLADKLRKSLQDLPRTAFVVYFNPQPHSVWEGIPVLTPYPVRQPVWPGHEGKVVAVWSTKAVPAASR